MTPNPMVLGSNPSPCADCAPVGEWLSRGSFKAKKRVQFSPGEPF